MKRWAFNLVIIFSFSQGQWINLDLTTSLGAGFRDQVAPLVQGLALATTGSETRPPGPNHRMAISANLVALHSETFRGTVPMMFGVVSVARNLTLSGSAAAFRSGSEVLMHTGYGMGIVPGESPWQISLRIGTLSGARNLRLHSLRLAASYDTRILHLPLEIQFGFINTRARFTFPGEIDPPRTMDRRFYAFQFATKKDWRLFSIVPKLIWHPKVILLSLETRLNIY